MYLLRIFFAYVQTSYYWFMFLLVCTFICIETFFCSCAKVKLLRNSFAFVQYEYYWVPPLLICNHLLTCRKTLIDTISCLCAIRWLFNISYCLCARVILLNIFLACVQWPTYWLSWLLVCRWTVIKYLFLLVCSNVLIEGTFCLGACFLLLTLKIAYVQLSSYWFALLLGEIFIKVISLLIYATSPLLRENLAIMQFHYYWRYRLLMCRTFLIDDITCLCAIELLLKT